MPPSVADEKGRCRSEQGGEGASPWGTLYVYIPMDRVVSSQVRYDWTLQTYMTVSPITVVEKVHGSLYIHIFFRSSSEFNADPHVLHLYIDGLCV